MSAPILKIDITANANQLIAAINKANARVKELGATIQTLPTGDKQFNKLSRELARTQNTIKQLSDSYNKLGIQSEEVAPKLQQVGNASKSARTALTSLSLTIQDLPFGFLGVQNNLPGVIQGFGNLTATTNGKVLPAFKEIGKSLLGPAGIFLGFSAVTSIVTVAIQKYGSLGDAFNALISNAKVLTKEQRDFAENLAKESTEVITLTSLYKSFEGDRKKQYEIIQKLNQISPQYFGNLKAEKTNLDEVNKSLDRYINSFIAKIYIESQQKKINELFTKYAEQVTKIVVAETERKKNIKGTKQELDGASKSSREFYQSVEQGIKRVGTGDISVGIKFAPFKQTTQDALDEIRNTLKTRLEGLFQEFDVFKGFINIDDLFKTPAIKENADDLNLWSGFAAKAAIAGMEFDRVAKETAARLAREQKNLENWRAILMQIGATYDMVSDRIGNTQVYMKSFGRLTDVVNRQFEGMFQNIQSTEAETGLNNLQNKINKVADTIDKRTDKQINDQNLKYKAYKNAIESFLIQPLNYLSDVVLKKAQFSWKDFGNIIIQQLQRIAVQLAATAIAGAIANVIAPGSTAAAGGAATLLGGVRRGRGGFSAVDFNGLQGGMSLSGQVIFVQRGSDLVGVLNRTNATINRVG